MKSRPEDIVFVVSPLLWAQYMYPTGILCLSGYLESRGFPNIILDSKLSIPHRNIGRARRENLILEQIRELKPRIVCFSSTHMEFDEVTRMNTRVKEIDEKIISIVGGSQPTYRATDFLDNGFSFTCIGVGEATLFEFVQEIIQETYRWSEIKGLAWKKNGQNIFNPPRPHDEEAELIDLAMPAYEKLDTRYFEMNSRIVRGLAIRGAMLLTTRGCPYSCSYCGCNLIFGRKLRYKTLENVEKEVKYLKENHGIEGFWLIDDTFTVNKAHVEGVSRILKKYGMVWACQSRVDTINEEMIKMLKDAGCVQIDFGVESGSQRILDEIIGKGISIDQVINAFRLAKQYNIRTFANFMVGLPTETYDDLQKTRDLADKIDADEYIFSIATPLPGTKLYDMVGEEISPHEYSLLNWCGSVLTPKVNRSEIKDLVLERDNLEKRYAGKSKWRSFLSLCNPSFFLNRSWKLQRLKIMLRFLVGFFLRLIFRDGRKRTRR
ncbi:MAG: radical SAM protein [Candidatus Ozemobacteraceae bacterium]